MSTQALSWCSAQALSWCSAQLGSIYNFVDDHLYEANKVYNATISLMVAYNAFHDPKANVVEFLTDAALHALQASVRKDGNIGVKIDILGIDWKLPTPGGLSKMALYAGNTARIVDIAYRGFFTSSSIANGPNVIDTFNHSVNLILASRIQSPQKPKVQ